ncbi:hypothetical protein ACIRVK_42325 [Streptomyces sp. NPDC101152]|uniref:hypothetical protein n=1 Tax=Streptomyces sp. NPDC101152 TaxID=3366116 RepID=UPI00380CC134
MTAVAASGTASAYNNCGEVGVYYCQAVTGTAGGVRLATTLGADHHEYAQAWGTSGASNWAYYMDRSSDGGATWQGWIDPVYNTSEWTGEIDGGLYDGPPYVTRACITDFHTYVCTAWH